ncbi:hypothetical protein M8C21_002375, partial [Ambrosia artemisiifolia]
LKHASSSLLPTVSPGYTRTQTLFLTIHCNLSRSLSLFLSLSNPTTLIPYHRSSQPHDPTTGDLLCDPISPSFIVFYYLNSDSDDLRAWIFFSSLHRTIPFGSIQNTEEKAF